MAACETCGTEVIDNCTVCGAPQCCPKCCREATEEYRARDIRAMDAIRKYRIRVVKQLDGRWSAWIHLLKGPHAYAGDPADAVNAVAEQLDWSVIDHVP